MPIDQSHQQAIKADVLTNYALDFTQVIISPLGNGHINSTYKITTPEAEFVLQKINHTIFPKTKALFSNTEKVNQHLAKQKALGNYDFLVPKQLLTKDKQTYCELGKSYWRLMEYITDSNTVEMVTWPRQAKQVAKAFAHFSAALSDFDCTALTVMIDDFHNINVRLAQLTQAIEADRYKRLASCQHLVDFCSNESAFIDEVHQITAKLPLHVTHNDTKINNLLFTSAEQPCAVIDLDTCMPGYLMYDFGDMVRSCCSNLAEDDANIENMTIKLDIFQALIINYQSAFGDKLTVFEKHSLITGAKLLPFMLGVRFLTDYLNDDIYFNTTRETQNLDRAINQLHMYKLLSQTESKLIDLAKY